MNPTEEKIVGVLEALDEAGNVLLGPKEGIPLAGNPHATMSQRLGQEEIMGTPEQKKAAKFWDKVLTWIEVNIFRVKPKISHCQDAILDFPTDLPKTG